MVCSLIVSEICHVRLGMEDGNIAIPDSNIEPSSTEPGNSPSNIRLNGPQAWAPDTTDTNPSVTIDLDEPMKVTGVILQGGGPGTDEYVTEFTVSYSLDDVTWIDVAVGNEPTVSRPI